MYQQALLSWGNLQYEESQMVAVAGGDWRAVLDEATAHFREAGCNEADIRGACLRTHIAIVFSCDGTALLADQSSTCSGQHTADIYRDMSTTALTVHHL